MISDFSEFEDGATIESDVCIVGAGAAGITLARSLIGSKLQVCVLESGGFEYEEDTQLLYEGENRGRDYYALDVCRLRYFGGSTNHWGGWIGPLQPHDLEAKSWVSYSGWPLSYGELEMYYEAAQSVCGAGPFVYDGRLWQEFEVTPPPLDHDKLTLRFWRHTWPFRFGEVYEEELRQAANVRIVLNANLAHIRTNEEGNTVQWLDIRSLDGRAARIEARSYVLACGGIENARLLLASNDVRPNGLGNDQDLVGRFFMDHLGARCATIKPIDPMKFLRVFRWFKSGTDQAHPGFCPSSRFQQRYRTLNAGLWVDHAPDPNSGPWAARAIWRAVQEGRWPRNLGDQLVNIMTDFDDIVIFAVRRIEEVHIPIYPPEDIFLFSEAEQSPNPDSRITLSQERDALGMRRSVLHWRLSEIDKRSLRSIVESVGQELGRLNIARIKIEEWLLDDSDVWGDDLRGAYHHIGTTRMSDDPRTGVVDSNCRLHAMDNLYIAGSSVFPSEGYINPTLTIVALALRLGDHLKRKLG